MKKCNYILLILVLLLLISNIYLWHKLDKSVDHINNNNVQYKDETATETITETTTETATETATETTIETATQILNTEEISLLVDEIINDTFENRFSSGVTISQDEDFELLLNQGINSAEIVLNKFQNVEGNGGDAYNYAFLLESILGTDIGYSSGKGYLNALSKFNDDLDMNYLKIKIAESHGDACLNEMIINMSILSMHILEEYMKYGRRDINEPYLELLNYANKNNQFSESELFDKVDAIRFILNEHYESIK